MIYTVNGAMIALARQARGFSQRALASKLGWSQAMIARYENGWTEVPGDHLVALSQELARPVSFFSWREKIYGASCLYHRRRQKIPARELTAVHAQVNLLRMQATRLLQYTEVVSPYSFHRLELSKLKSPEEAARRLRKLWQLPTGPVESVVDSIEVAGGVVFRCPFESTKVDGISQWPLDMPELPPVFFVSDAAPGDRERWTLAHEIGHIVLHHLPTDDPEREANRFAAELLMPTAEIIDELQGLTLQKAAALKSYWKVSMQAIILWAKALGKINQDQYEYLLKLMSARGYRLCEPVIIPAEEPRLLREMLAVHRRASGKTVADLSDYLGILEHDFREQYLQSLTGFRLVG